MEAAMNLGDHPERDLILHLIAAHHGWARPQFEPTSLDNTYKTEDNERAAIEVLRRFGQLQRRFGRWGLAWLEAILRCADIAASKQPSEAPATTCIEELQA
jgi:CRISPR-associated endonuclease/helicase Cas3